MAWPSPTEGAPHRGSDDRGPGAPIPRYPTPSEPGDYRSPGGPTDSRSGDPNDSRFRGPLSDTQATGPALATVGSRILGKAIDGLILSPIVLLALSQSGALAQVGKSNAVPHMSPGLLIVIYLITGVYEIALTALRGQTLGCMATKIRIQDARTGRIPRWGQAGIRWLVPTGASFVPIIGIFLSLLVYAFMLWDPRRQGLHDKASGVVVVKVAPPAYS